MKILGAALAAVVLVGCAVPVASLTLVASRPIRLDEVGTARSRGVREGRTCHLWVLGIPFGLPHVEDAIEDALAPSGGTFMRDVTVLSVHPIYGLFGWHCYVVRGTVFSGR